MQKKYAAVNAFKAKLLVGVSSLFIISLYATGCGREAKITLTDHYKPVPINLVSPENSERASNNGSFSTDLTKAKASLNLSALDDVTSRTELAFATADLLDCRTKLVANNLMEVAIRFSNVTSGSLAVSYVTPVDPGAAKVAYHDSTEVKRIEYKNTDRKSYTALGIPAICVIKTAFVKGKEVRATFNCSLRGAKENIQLNSSLTCHVLGGI